MTPAEFGSMIGGILLALILIHLIIDTDDSNIGY
jgi:hypothetical protein